MTERRRILLFSIGIMAAVSLSTAAIATKVFYDAWVDVHRARLKEVVESRARIIEAIARFYARLSEEEIPGGAVTATLSQLVEAHERFPGFGETGEFVLARREGDRIVWLMKHRHGDDEKPEPMAFDSELAAPMHRALSGESGTILGPDYRGVEVLAAYEWLPELGWGVVAKIDLAEIRRPLRRAGVMVSGVALAAIALGVGFIVRVTSPLIQRIEARTEELEKAHERLRSHSAEVSKELEQERRRLAVDLHDGIGQLLALARIKLGLLRHEPKTEVPDPRIQEIEGIVGEAHERSGDMTWQISPPAVYEVGLVAALRWLAKDMERRYGLRVTVEEEGQWVRIEDETRISLFRSVNELLINVAKHAKIDRALVRVSYWTKDIMIVVEDEGVGFDSSSVTNEYGLFSVRERMYHVGGILKVSSEPGEGTKIILVVPVAVADPGANRESK